MDGLVQRAEDLAQEVVSRAAERGLTVASAESCTAGMVASTIAGVPGASEVLRGGAVTYCDEVKHEVLGVSADALARWSAVSRPVAAEMARGARELFRADAAVSCTGYAGPGGGTPEDPAGTVYIGCVWGAGERVERCHFEGTRNEVRLAATVRALEMLLEALV